MEKEYFRKENESETDYLTRMAALIGEKRKMQDACRLTEGEAEQLKEMENVVFAVIEPRLKELAMHVCKDMGSEFFENFYANLMTEVWYVFPAYNRGSGERYAITTFANNYVHQAYTQTTMQIHGFSERVYRKVRKVNKTLEYVMKEEGCGMNGITAKQIYEAIAN